MRTKISNKHQAVLCATLGNLSEQWKAIEALYVEYNRPYKPWTIAHQIDRLGCWRLRRNSRPTNALDDVEDLRDEFDPTPPPPAGIVGELRVDQATGYFDDRGPYLPISCHHMNGLWLHKNRRDDSLRQLDKIAERYDIVRTIMSNGWTGTFWNNRETFPTDPGYDDNLDDYFAELQRRNLRLDITFEATWSRGETFRDVNHLKEFMRRVGDIADGYPNLIALCEWNEVWQTYMYRNPPASEIKGVMEAFVESYEHPMIRAIGDPQFEDTDAFNEWSWDIFCKHGWRSGNTEDRTRHVFTTKYREGGIPNLWMAFETEPPGHGTSVAEERNVEGMCVLHLMNLICGYGTTYMSGDGIKWNQPLDRTPGFVEVSRVRELLPTDIFTYRQMEHGGRDESPLKAADFDEIARVDLNLNGRKFVGLAYNPGPVRDGKIEARRNCRFSITNVVGHDTIWAGQLNAGQTVNVSFDRGVLLKGTEV